MQFSVAVFARLSRAGIDAFTLQVGRAICYNFALEPYAQERICDAVFKLKKYGSYKDLIWFGFGIKDVVTDLADTEEGLTLVALCAALSTTYDSMFAVMVIRELCVLCKAPQSSTPALRQWKTLVGLYTGMLTSAHFVVIANGFRRLISGHTHCCNPLLDCFLCDSRSLLLAVLCLFWPYMGPWGPLARYPSQPIATLQHTPPR